MTQVLLTGGIGDCMALESYWSPAFRHSVSKIFLACGNGCKIRELLSKVYSCPIEVLWRKDFSFFCFHNEKEVRRQFNLPDIEDWSIEVHFPYLANETFYGSSVLNHKLADVQALEKPFVVIVPDSPNEPRLYKMNNDDWHKTIELLEREDKVGIVLNTGEPTNQKHKRIIDLTNKTTICEAVELLKQSSGYIGIDSFLSVLAVQTLNRNTIRIKSANPHLYRYKEIYYSPHVKFPFLREELWP